VLSCKSSISQEEEKADKAPQEIQSDFVYTAQKYSGTKIAGNDFCVSNTENAPAEAFQFAARCEGSIPSSELWG
jgi:hypothetical protein